MLPHLPIWLALAALPLAAPSPEVGGLPASQAAGQIHLAQGSARSEPPFGLDVEFGPGWTSTPSGPDSLEARSGDETALCGLYRGDTGLSTSRELADILLAQHARDLLEARGLASTTVERATRSIPVEGRPAIKAEYALVEMTPPGKPAITSGGRSERLYLVIDHYAFLIDCETRAADWPRWHDDFEAIRSSLRVIPQ